MNILKTHYLTIIRKDLIMQYHYSNVAIIPKLNKIILNIGAKETLINKKKLVPSMLALELITGLKPFVTKSKKAIANFNLKQNYPIGLKVTLNKNQMYNFLLKITNTAIYLNKDFNGLDIKNFNNKGYLNTSIKDLSVFLEISNYYENFEIFQGIDLAFVTTHLNLHEAKSLLSGLRLPFIN